MEEKTLDRIYSDYLTELKELYPETEIRSIFRILVEHYLGWSGSDFLLNRRSIPGAKARKDLADALQRLEQAVPVQYITGKVRFLDMQLSVAPGILIPRPETEELARLIIQENRGVARAPFRVIDIGTGSGCLALAVKQAFPFADVMAIDNSEKAIEIAGRNAARNRLELDLRLMDMTGIAEKPGLPGFDMILSNPPYIPEYEKKHLHQNVVRHEPPGALFVPGDDPLFYFRHIAGFAQNHLNPGGLLYAEIHERFGTETLSLFQGGTFEKTCLLLDFHGKNRFIRVIR